MAINAGLSKIADGLGAGEVSGVGAENVSISLAMVATALDSIATALNAIANAIEAGR